MPDQGCTHIGAITAVKHRKRYECDECVKIGSEWVLKGTETLILRLALDQHRNRRGLCVELLRTTQEVPCSSGSAT